MKKWMRISLIIIILLISVLLSLKPIRLFIKKKYLEMYVNSIKYDIKITRYDRTQGGLGTNTKFELIEVKGENAYIVENNYINSVAEECPLKKGNNYRIEKKKISKEKIDALIDFINNYKNDNDEKNISIYFDYKWTIEYNGKEITLQSYHFIE